MSIQNKEYIFGVNSFNKPAVAEGRDAIAARLMTLIMMEPGDDPLHPDMGVGIKTYRYSLSIDGLANRIENQILTYLPFYQSVNVNIIRTPDKVCNVEITLGDTKYIYESGSSTKPIVLEDIQS
jgi:hypothetical protein